MEIREHLRQVAESVAEHPRRLIASSISVLWGTAAILLMMGWGTGFADYMRVEFSRFGEPSLFVIPGMTSSGFPGYREGVPVRASTREIERAERDAAGLVYAMFGEHRSDERVLVEARGRVRRLDLSATDPRFPEYRKFELAYGRFFDSADVSRRRAVVVLAWEAAHELLPKPAESVGRTIRIEGQPFELVGVLAEKVGRQYNNTNRPENRLVLVPSSTAEARLGFDRERVPVIHVYPRPEVDEGRALQTVLDSLASDRSFHPKDEDAVRHYSTSSMFQLMDAMELGFTWFMGLAGAVTLLVAAIGLANYHLATLTERSLEIATAKAIGARNGTLMGQIALEAVLVSVVAAAIGLALGLAGGAALGRFAGEFMPVPVISAQAVVVTASALVGVAIITALVPALRVRHIDVSLTLRG